ncbi:hypothetical protein V2G26_007974 [Clonostachys chloroleuca]
MNFFSYRPSQDGFLPCPRPRLPESAASRDPKGPLDGVLVATALSQGSAPAGPIRAQLEQRPAVAASKLPPAVHCGRVKTSGQASQYISYGTYVLNRC